MSGDVQVLIARWVEGGLDEPGRLRLAERLAADQELARSAAEQARYAVLLGLAWPRQGRSTAESVERLIEARRPSARLRLAEGIERRLGRRRRPRLLRLAALAAAATLVLGTALLLWPAAPRPAFRVVAGVAQSAAAAAVLEGGRVPADAGTVVAAERDLVLQAEDGARLALTAGSRIELRGRAVDGRQVVGLASGHLGWNAPHRAGPGGLHLALPQGSVVTEGTQFDCLVQDAAAVVRLAEGRVRVAGTAGGTVVLQPGEATVVRTGSPPSPPAAFPVALVWSGDGPAQPAVGTPQQVPWRFLPGVVPGKPIGTWSASPDGTQVCTAKSLPADFRWDTEPYPDHEVAVHAARRGDALVRLAHGSVLRFRIRAERSGSVNVTISVPSAPADPTLWAVSPLVAVEAGRWQQVELPVAGFWSRVKADWEAAAIAGLGIWGYGAGAFAVSSIEIGLQ